MQSGAHAKASPQCYGLGVLTEETMLCLQLFYYEAYGRNSGIDWL